MIRDERVTYQEIQALERKFDAWNQLTERTEHKSRAATAVAPLASARDITKDLPPQVAAFEVKYEATFKIQLFRHIFLSFLADFIFQYT